MNFIVLFRLFIFHVNLIFVLKSLNMLVWWDLSQSQQISFTSIVYILSISERFCFQVASRMVCSWMMSFYHHGQKVTPGNLSVFIDRCKFVSHITASELRNFRNVVFNWYVIVLRKGIVWAEIYSLSFSWYISWQVFMQ